MTSKLKNALASVAIVSVVATLTFAFNGPTKNPDEIDSSAGALLSKMAGNGFDTSTDSLSVLSDKFSEMLSDINKNESSTFIDSLQDIRNNIYIVLTRGRYSGPCGNYPDSFCPNEWSEVAHWNYCTRLDASGDYYNSFTETLCKKN